MPDGITRRTALCAAALGALTSSLAACGSAAPRRTGGTGTAKPGDRLAGLADVPVGGGVLVDVPGDAQLLLVRPEEDVVRAFDPTCPHADTLVGPPSGGVITCPTHRSTFDPATGAVRRGPATGGLAEVPVTTSGQDVLLG
ncbi:Rieske (2Fe-2S) protein [Umezawaea beigongshangensis]|uniref:Rieske (2Fe-2S) protein n=1 Tax=Umezawaea beigongshangensis TaxID=2780383 RepID=UPI0027DB34B5|nr:Rieske (2Fe-2S) protein [Umezawaea beigongshangensis]